jgi:5-(carboxyamino)imidazole ribonucleotide mutase
MPQIHVVIGSESDLEALNASGMIDVFNQVDPELSYTITVCSAHRNSTELDTYVKAAVVDGAKVFIGIAGMAAALPGALAAASNVARPVIAVPLDEKGIDSCLYMPPGVPVLLAGVGKAGLKNAAIAACQILATGGDARMATSLTVYLDRNRRPALYNVEL